MKYRVLTVIVSRFSVHGKRNSSSKAICLQEAQQEEKLQDKISSDEEKQG